MARNISNKQLWTMVEFMEKNGDISIITNTPQERQRRRELWRKLKMLLENLGGPVKSVEQWAKTWADTKHRVKRKNLQNRTFRIQGRAKKLPLSEIDLKVTAILGSTKKPSLELSEDPLLVPWQEQADLSSKVIIQSSETFVPDPVTKEEPLQPKPEQIMWLQQVIPTGAESAKKPHEPFMKMFAEMENKRLQFEKDRARKQDSLEERRLALDERRQALEERRLAYEERQEERAERLRDYESNRLQLEILRENNLHEREAVRAQIDRDGIKIQKELFDLIKQALNKFPQK